MFLFKLLIFLFYMMTFSMSSQRIWEQKSKVCNTCNADVVMCPRHFCFYGRVTLHSYTHKWEIDVLSIKKNNILFIIYAWKKFLHQAIVWVDCIKNKNNFFSIRNPSATQKYLIWYSSNLINLLHPYHLGFVIFLPFPP